MTLPIFLVHLTGAVFLLLFAVRLVRTGVERACGPNLRDVLVGTQRGAIPSAVVGIFVAILLQSSTATAILTVGFVAGGIISFANGMAIILGADLGSALVVQVLTFRLEWIIPVFLALGGWMYLRFDGRFAGQIGRVILGVALILLSLTMITQASAPMRESTLVPVIANYLQNEVATAFLLGACFAFLMHSSVAAILLCVTLAAQQVLSVEVAAAIVLGANLGGALLPVWLTRNVKAQDRRIVFANAALRGAGAVAAVGLLLAAPGFLALSPLGPVQTLVSIHLAFNTVILLLGIAFLRYVERASVLCIPQQKNDDDSATLRPKSALDPSVLGTPSLALASVLRENLRMGEMVETMVVPVMNVFSNPDPRKIHEIQNIEDDVNKCFDDIRRYAADMSHVGLSKPEAKQARELTDYSINLETAGDRVVKNLLPLASEKKELNVRFSDKGWKELNEAHSNVISNIQLALNVLIKGDVASARLLIEHKATLTRLIRTSRKRHLKRLAAGEEMSFETSDIHLETLNALKEINSLFASVAYPILYKNNLMLETRLIGYETEKMVEETDTSI